MRFGVAKNDRGVFPSTGLETVSRCVLVGPLRAGSTIYPPVGPVAYES